MKVLVTFGMILMAFSVFAQKRMGDLLSFPISEGEMGVVLAREEYLSTHKFNSPWLRELDFRIRPNDVESSISDYRLRFGILNPFEIKANREYHKLLIRQQSFERKKTINDVLKRRYELILEGHYLIRSVEIAKQNLNRLNEFRTIMLEEGFVVGKVIALDEKITKQELALMGLNRNIKLLMPAYQLLGIDSISAFLDDTWISKEQLADLVTQSESSQTLRLQMEQQELDRKASILEINKAEAFSNLGFVQAEYNAEEQDSRDEQVTFQIGLQIPIFNTDRPDNQRRELALIEDQVDYQAMVAEEEESRRSETLLFTDYLREWDLISEKVELLKSYEQVIEEVGGGVEDYERLQSYRFFLEGKKLRVSSDVYLRYINLLAETGDLSNQPYKNFLDADLAPFALEGG